jgi:hypothetical protein
MCGIVAYLGKKAAQPILIEGLKRLEYRGYDSAGVALLGSGAIRINKTSGRINALRPWLAQVATHSPDAFAPGSSFFAASALCNIAVYDNKPHRLLSKIIGRFNARRSNEPEISFAVFTEAICKILCRTTFRNIVQRNIEGSFSTFVHSFCKSVFCKFFGFVKNAEHITHSIKKFLAVICGEPFVPGQSASEMVGGKIRI